MHRVKKSLPWLALLAVSLPLGAAMHRTGFPAAFLVGPMLAAIALGAFGVRLVAPRRLLVGAQALLGAAVGETVTATILVSIVRDWVPMALIVGSTVLAGGLVGWMLVRLRTLPGTTAAWGTIPGGAAAMVAMAEEHGADARLVALMHYLRVIIVVLTASVVAQIIAGAPLAAGAVPAHSFAAFWATPGIVPLLLTLAVAGGGALLARWLRIPAGAILVPMLLGGALHASDLVAFAQPLWLRSCAAVALGWYVGLRFDRDILIFAFRLLPRLLVSTFLLLVLCAFSAWLLAAVLGTDPLTAYLATSPGGLDSVVLIALGSRADVPFVVAVQSLRLIVVILTGPAIARLICRHA